MPDDALEDDRATRRSAVRQHALMLLARREHAPAELAVKLRRRGAADDDIDAVLATLIEQDLLSPRRYAHAVVAAKSARGIGPVRIRAELAAAAIDDALIQAALAQAEIDWNALARAAREKRFGPRVPEDFPAQAKQKRFLQRRGFDADQLRAVFSH